MRKFVNGHHLGWSFSSWPLGQPRGGRKRQPGQLTWTPWLPFLRIPRRPRSPASFLHLAAPNSLQKIELFAGGHLTILTHNTCAPCSWTFAIFSRVFSAHSSTFPSYSCTPIARCRSSSVYLIESIAIDN